MFHMDDRKISRRCLCSSNINRHHLLGKSLSGCSKENHKIDLLRGFCRNNRSPLKIHFWRKNSAFPREIPDGFAYFREFLEGPNNINETVYRVSRRRSEPFSWWHGMTNSLLISFEWIDSMIFMWPSRENSFRYFCRINNLKWSKKLCALRVSYALFFQLFRQSFLRAE